MDLYMNNMEEVEAEAEAEVNWGKFFSANFKLSSAS